MAYADSKGLSASKAVAQILDQFLSEKALLNTSEGSARAEVVAQHVVSSAKAPDGAERIDFRGHYEDLVAKKKAAEPADDDMAQMVKMLKMMKAMKEAGITL